MAKLVGAAMIRNEADIVEAFVRHNLSVLDGLALVDHGSQDGTSAILAALVAEGLPLTVARDESAGHHQSAIMTRLVREVLARTGADFVCALDADEFVKVRSRPLLDRVLQQVPPGMHALVDWQTYVPEFAGDPGADVRAIIAGARRLAHERHGMHKVVVARSFLDAEGAVIAPGNHLVVPAADAGGAPRSNPHAKIAPEVLALAHVPVRSRDQFAAKVAVGWLATLATRGAANVNFHWREACEDIVAGRPLTPERLTDVAVNYGVPRSGWRDAAVVARLDDPFLADFELRHARLAHRDPLALVLAFAARLAAGA